jgi:hypothetical protein
MVDRASSSRPVRVAFVTSLALFLVSAGALVWTRSRPTIDRAEAEDVAARARVLLGPAPEGPLLSAILAQPCQSGATGWLRMPAALEAPESEGLCEVTRARLAAERGRDTTIVDDLGGQALGVRAGDGAAPSERVTLALDLLWLLARSESADGFSAHARAELDLVQELASNVGGSEGERDEALERAARIQARRPRALEHIHRAIVFPDHTVAPETWSDEDELLDAWVCAADAVAYAERARGVGCGANARACLEGLTSLGPTCRARPWLGLLGPRFDRCAEAHCPESSPDLRDAAMFQITADIAVAILIEVLAHDPEGAACREGPLPSLVYEGEPLRVTRGPAITVHLPAWLEARRSSVMPEHVVLLPCQP